MSYTVTLKNSGNSFTLEGHETILRAGLRAGINLGHQCMNGSCGGCAAKLLEGQIIESRIPDFKLPQNTSDHQFLSCCYRAESDLLLDMPELDEARQIPLQQLTTKVTRLQKLKNNIYELTLKTPRSQLLEFLAGQRALIQLPGLPQFALGIASCPCDGMNLRFHIDQRLLPSFDIALKKGQRIQLTAPVGQLTLHEQSHNALLFIAYETGFAQIQSLIDHVISQDEDRQIQLLCLTSSTDGFYRENACRAWRDVLDHFSYEVIYLPDNHFDNFTAFLKRMARRKKTYQHVDIYAVMPPSKVRLLKTFCQKNQHPQGQLHTDTLRANPVS